MAEEDDVDINSFKEDTYWEDLYTNGTTDDSNYDILVDIKNIWNLLFTSFISPTETLFYKLPQNRSTSTSNLFSNILGAVWNNSSNGTENMWTFTNWSNGGNTNGGNTNWWSGTDWIQTAPTDTNNWWPIDPSLGKFITKTNTTYTTTTTTSTKQNKVNLQGVAQGNICIPSVSAGNTNTTTTTNTEANTITIQEYLDGLDEAAKWGIPTVDQPNKEIIDGQNGDENIDEWELAIMSKLIEDKINNIFDPVITKSCTTKCSDTSSTRRQSCIDQSNAKKILCDKMDYIDKVICNKNRSDAERTCREPLIGEETICRIECLCFTIGFPKSQVWLEGMDRQSKLRFCSIPVQQNRISKGKDILWRDDSLSRIKAVFENLLNGWEMVKYQRNKEYLDSPLAGIKRDKIISFDIKIYLKALFSSVGDKAKKEEKARVTKKTEESIKSNPIAENQKNMNKLVDDLAIQQAKKDPTLSYADLQKNVLEEAEKIRASKPVLDPKKVVNNSKNQKAIIFNEQILTFLDKNSKIRWSITEEMRSFQQLSSALNNTLKSAK